MTEAGILKLSLEAISGSASVAAVSDGSADLLSDLRPGFISRRGLLLGFILGLLPDSHTLRLDRILTSSLVHRLAFRLAFG